jgi:DNA-binding transcriptional LysR family regulator
MIESWDDLKYILAIHRHGGISAAARALNVNHSTVSRRLSNLEEKMDARLFDRLSSGLRTTQQGEQCVESALIIEQQLHSLDVNITAKDSQLAGPLKISAPQLIIQYHLADIIKAFMDEYPLIDLTLIATTDAINLFRREADISIRAMRDPEETLWGRKVISQNCTYYAHKDYLANLNDPQKLECINFMWHGNEVAPEVLTAYPQARVCAKFDDMIAVIGAVQSQMGIARMPCFIGDAQPDFMRVPNIDKEPYHDIWILTHPDLKDVARIKAFMRFCAADFKKREILFAGD